MAQKAVVTIATGKKYFIDLASNLARSFLLHNQTQEISFRLVTDQISYVPEDLKKKLKYLKSHQADMAEVLKPNFSWINFQRQGKRFLSTQTALFMMTSILFLKN